MKCYSEHRKAARLLSALFLSLLPLSAQELPRPTLDNSVLVSIEHYVTDSAEVDYIKNNFPFGLYAWPSFSHTTIPINMSWTLALDSASTGIDVFKGQVNAIIAAAKAKKVRVHIVLTSGLARNIDIYKDAKLEDIRNGQWYNDNKIASDSQIAGADPISNAVMGTLSRYARKVRANLYAKSKAALEFLRQVMNANPDTLLAVSGWGEAELNYRRINNTNALQSPFCDFSPFAVLEFRDWIQHAGLYDDASGTYRAQGFQGGGTKYQGAAGLAQFNTDFGTAFTTWDLCYFDWSLSDDYDQVPQDGTNPDPHRVPYSSYVHGGMMPASGPNFIAGGFDPPRTIQPNVLFWELWRMFRETMVHNFTHDLALWASQAGLPAERWYSHQIPGDYLYDTRPSNYPNQNARYFTSASPLWSADVTPYGLPGATIYDIKFPTWFVRTTSWILPAIQAMSSDWAIMEYDAETYPTGFTVAQSEPSSILAEYLKIYSYRVHLINFWRWIDGDGEHTIKGMNKEIALREFIRRIRDKGRNTDLTTVFVPPKASAPQGAYSSASSGVDLAWSDKIWSNLDWKWTDWGDYHHFEIFRGDRKDFPADTDHMVGTTSSFAYTDKSAQPSTAYYYRIRAVNVLGARGPASDGILIPTSETAAAILTVDRQSLFFGAETGKAGTSGQTILIVNAGSPLTTLHWTAAADQSWVQISPASGTGSAATVVQITAAGLAPGTYFGRITVSDPLAFLSPQVVDVTLKVLAAGGDAVPFGSFDSPVDGSSGSGSIAVTGWALDDVEVARVEIKRDADPSDPLGAIDPNDGLVYIGDAVFVQGARPDVETSNPGVPRNDRAGWGYMLLTNFLPGGGNGTYLLYAFAFDSAGHKVELGRRNFSSNNANRTKPFGTIDTPPQGGIVTGSQFVNFGWALTALPHFIPVDGSTISVWVDGISLGHPDYGHYRSDVAAAFPGLANSQGAVGFFYLDTTAYNNGLHTIVWTVADSNGDADGIGSRFFTIANMGASPQTPGAPVASRLFVMPSGTSGSVYVQKGYGQGVEAETVFSSPDGWVDIAAAPLDRLVLYLDPTAVGLPDIDPAQEGDRPRKAFGGADRNPPGLFAGTVFEGYQMVGTQYRALPVGSTFDPAAGVFSWQIGPGFLGDFNLLFVRKAGRMGTQRTLVRIRVSVR